MVNEKSKKGMIKGAPSGVMVSLLLHGCAFFMAGLLVVFTVSQKEEKRFVPPAPVNRPKMKLKKPQVKVKKTNKPKPTNRIVTKVKRANMPDIQLPEMSGVGDGLVGGIGGFEIIPDLSETTLFGDGKSIGYDFVGTFYDFKRTRSGGSTPMDPDNFRSELGQFVRSGFRPSRIAKYYQSPNKLYATSFLVPAVRSSVAPAAFGEKDTVGYCWMAHYRGMLVYSENVRIRFRGMGDDVMVVMVDGEVVLNASWPGDSEATIAGFWQSTSADSRRFQLGNNTAVVGDWIDLKAGEAKDMEIIIGEVPGGAFSAMLVVEIEGEEYPENAQGGPILPMFKTEKPSRDLLDRIYETFVRGEAAITNGPVFNDLGGGTIKIDGGVTEEQEGPPVAKADNGEGSRIWTATTGDAFEAEYVSTIGDKIVFRNSLGNTVRLPVDQLSEVDRDYIDLSNPPDFSMNGTRKSSQRILEMSPYNQSPPPRILDYVFGAKVQQLTARPYNHELTVELFAVGQQYFDDEKFVLLDRVSDSFIPSKANKRSHSFNGKPVEVMSFDQNGQTYGTKYYGYLAKLIDSRGVVIQVEASSEWMKENYKNLEKLEKGWFFDETCNRVIPTGPKRTY